MLLRPALSRLAAPAVVAALTASALTGCGTTPAPAAATPVALTITLADGRATPNAAVVAVRLGSPVTLTIVSDRADAVHLHGFDREIEVTPGSRQSVTITADKTGRFEIETHHPVILVAYLDVS